MTLRSPIGPGSIRRIAARFQPAKTGRTAWRKACRAAQRKPLEPLGGSLSSRFTSPPAHLMTPLDPTAVSQALGRIPSGLFIVTTRLRGEPLGFLGSLAQQVGFAPPTVCIAMARDRAQSTWFAESGRFALSILDEASAGLRTVFLKRLPEGRSPFDDLKVGAAASGSPVLLDALAWIDCRIVARHDTADHAVFFGEVEEAQLLRPGRPHVHLRKNGLAY